MTCSHVLTFATGAMLASLVAWSAAPAPADSVPKWEYKIVDAETGKAQLLALRDAKFSKLRLELSSDAEATSAATILATTEWLRAIAADGWQVVSCGYPFVTRTDGFSDPYSDPYGDVVTRPFIFARERGRSQPYHPLPLDRGEMQKLSESFAAAAESAWAELRDEAKSRKRSTSESSDDHGRTVRLAYAKIIEAYLNAHGERGHRLTEIYNLWDGSRRGPATRSTFFADYSSTP